MSPAMQPIDEEPSPVPPAPPSPEQGVLPTVRILSKANPLLSLTGLWGGKVMMSLGNGSSAYQQWIVDSSWGSKFTDAVGSRAFMLINKATGLVLRHSYFEYTPVSCSSIYKTDIPDALWTKGPVVGFGFHTIRACSKMELDLDIDHEKKRLPVWDGSKVVMSKCSEQETEYWKMEPLFLLEDRGR